MQYKIPIQIENEDVIVAGLSLRQLIIMMVWGGIGYAVFKKAEGGLGPEVWLFLAIPFVLIGLVVALMRVSEMTFLPATLNFFRLSLNARDRMWSQGTDGFTEMDIGYVAPTTLKSSSEPNQSLDALMDEDTSINEKILKL